MREMLVLSMVDIKPQSFVLMLKPSSAFLLAVFLSNVALGADIDCEGAAADEYFLSEQYSFRVAGSGRLHLHTAPDDRCIDKKVFVVPGDRLNALTVSGKKGEWVSVTYYAKNGDDVSGWVKTDRLMFTGASGMNMTPEKASYYTEAARKAKLGKLGLP